MAKVKNSSKGSLTTLRVIKSVGKVMLITTGTIVILVLLGWVLTIIGERLAQWALSQITGLIVGFVVSFVMFTLTMLWLESKNKVAVNKPEESSKPNQRIQPSRRVVQQAEAEAEDEAV